MSTGRNIWLVILIATLWTFACDGGPERGSRSNSQLATTNDSSTAFVDKLRKSTGLDVHSVRLSAERIDVEVLITEAIVDPEQQLKQLSSVSERVWQILPNARAETVAVSAILLSEAGDRIERTTYFYYRSFPLGKEP